MYNLLLLGAGKIGYATAMLLGRSGDYDVLAADIDEVALGRLAGEANVRTVQLDLSDGRALRRAMDGRQSAVAACPFSLNPAIAAAALEEGLSYFDLTEDTATSKTIREVATSAKPGQVFMPQCGLAPGFISILARHLTAGFDRLDEVRLRVGALPLYPTNRLKYNLTWSTDGLINEYCNPCEVIHGGRLMEALPLEGLEHFSLDGVDYEAFNTSGGVGTLAETLAGQVRNLDYKTVRYRGHRDLMAFLLDELRLGNQRAMLKEILERAVPITSQDVALIFCTVTGWKRGFLTHVTDARKIYHTELFGEPWSAIQITTATAVAAVVDMYHNGVLAGRGLLRQEDVPFESFITNRFGRYYETSAHRLGGAAAAFGEQHV